MRTLIVFRSKWNARAGKGVEMDLFWLLIACSWKALAMIAFTALLIRLLPRTSAAERCNAWTISLLALLALPALSFLWTNVEFPFGAADSVAGRVLRLPASAVAITVFAGNETRLSWHNALTLIWAMGALLVFARFAAAVLAGRRYARGAERWKPELPEWKREEPILCSNAAVMPMAVGVLRPRIVLPAAAKDWPSGTLLRVVAHEGEHIRRNDGAWKAATTAVAALYWFHPAVWHALRNVTLERERACDDAVLNQGHEPSRYAEDLITFARRGRSKAASGVAIGMAAHSHLETRIRAILDGQNQRQTLRRTTMLKFALSALLLLLPLSALQSLSPSPASFQSAHPPLDAETGPRERVATSIHGVISPNAGRDVPLQILRPQFPTTEAAVASAQASDAPTRIRVGRPIARAKLRKKVSPEYPASAKADGIAGTVILSIVIDRSGKVKEVKVVKHPDERLAKAAVEAVKQWEYEPTLLNGKPVEVATEVAIDFTLSKAVLFEKID